MNYIPYKDRIEIQVSGIDDRTTKSVAVNQNMDLFNSDKAKNLVQSDWYKPKYLTDTSTLQINQEQN